jgi:hypothetical protein
MPAGRFRGGLVSRSLLLRRLLPRGVASLAVAAALGAVAGPAAAGPIVTLSLAPGSALVPAAGDPAPLTGTLGIELGALPVAGATTLRLLDVAVAGGGVSIRLDPTIANAGLGVLEEDGSFLIPTLFLVVDTATGPVDLAIPDVAGLADLAGGALRGLTTSFEVDTLGPAGVVRVDLVAVPEPGPLALLSLAVAALAAGRREDAR